VTTTQETGAHVTLDRIRKGAAAMERAGFRLVYECPLGELEDSCPPWLPGWSRRPHGSGYVFTADYSTPGEDGRMA